MAQPGSMPLDAPCIHDKDSSKKMAESEEPEVPSSDAAGVNILRWEDDGGQTIEYRARADRCTPEPAKRNN